jgi:hypothetical protein
MDLPPWSNLWTIRDGRILRFEWFREADEALIKLEGEG